MATILLTGFEPFAGHQQNPSGEVARLLDGEIIRDAKIVGLVLPVVFGEDTARVLAALAELKPSLVLSLGLNAGTPCLDIERFAVNLRYAEYGKPPQETIIPNGPGGYLATIDAEAVAAAVRASGVPARAHEYAGAYLCNHILYHTLHYVSANNLVCRAGFLHLPLSTEQVIAEQKPPLASLPLELIARGVRAAIEASIGLIEA